MSFTMQFEKYLTRFEYITYRDYSTTFWWFFSALFLYLFLIFVHCSLISTKVQEYIVYIVIQPQSVYYIFSVINILLIIIVKL